MFAGVGPALVNSSSPVFVKATQVTRVCPGEREREGEGACKEKEDYLGMRRFSVGGEG